jgi:hypothetical protein
MPKLISRTCAECGQSFKCAPGPKKFCSNEHRKAFDNRNRARGYLIVPLVQMWRKGKNGRTEDTAYALQQMARLADLWNEEDKAAGRRPDLVVSRRNQACWDATQTLDAPPRLLPAPATGVGAD